MTDILQGLPWVLGGLVVVYLLGWVAEKACGGVCYGHGDRWMVGVCLGILLGLLILICGLVGYGCKDPASKQAERAGP